MKVRIKNKGGASPGAIFVSGDDEYLVKLNMPPGHGPINLKIEADFDSLVANISKEACNEKIFFNIAQIVGNNKYIIPETNVELLQPREYDEHGRSIDTLSKERITTDVRGNRMSYDSATVIERLKDQEIYHFSSKIIPSYRDLSEYYYYHNKENILGSRNIMAGIPQEPEGMGAFFALNCFTGNRDCIGLTGKNAGIDPNTFKIIIVDGGLSQDKAEIIKSMPSSANNHTWFSYDLDLTDSSRLEALETFVRLVELNEEQIRGILTNYGEFIKKGIFTPEEIDIKLQKFVEQQKQVVGVFYVDLKTHGLVTEKIEKIKEDLSIAKAQKEARRAMSSECFKTQTDTVKKTPLKRKNLGLSIQVTPPTPKGMDQSNFDLNSITQGLPNAFNDITQDLRNDFNDLTTSPSSDSSTSKSTFTPPTTPTKRSKISKNY